MTELDEFRPRSNDMAVNGRGPPGTTEKQTLLDEEGRLRTRTTRKRVGYVTAFVAFTLIAVAVLIVVAVLHRRVESKSKPVSKQSMNFGDIFNGNFSVRLDSDVRWMPTSSRLYRTDQGNDSVVRVKVADPLQYNSSSSKDAGDVWRVLVELPYKITNAEGFPVKVVFSADERFLLFSTLVEYSSRYSTISKCYVMDLSRPNEYLRVIHEEEMRYITWSKTGAGLLMVTDSAPNVVRVIPDVSDANAPISEPWNLTVAVGKRGEVKRGIPDWLYEEEILNSDGAMWVSPTDKYLAFLELNETKVSYFDWIEFGRPSEAYTSLRRVRYPKAGLTNPVPSLKVITGPFSSTSTPRTSMTLSPPIGYQEYLMQASAP